MVFVFLEILFKMLLFKGGVLIYDEHCICGCDEIRLGLARMWWYPCKSFWNVYIRDATIQFFRTDSIPNILRNGLYRFNPIPAQFIFLNQCVISILLCVDLIVTLLCVKQSITVFLNWWVKSAAHKWVTECIHPKKRHQQKKRNSKYFSDAGLLF